MYGIQPRRMIGGNRAYVKDDDTVVLYCMITSMLAVLMGFNIRKIHSRMAEDRIGRRFLTDEVVS